MSNNPDVVFRRIRGRIIPIKRKAGELKNLSPARKKEAAKGAAIAGVGVGVAAGGGYAYKKTMLKFLGVNTAGINLRDAFENSPLNSGQLDLFKHGPQIAKNSAEASKLIDKSFKIAKFGRVIRYAAPLAGAGLIAYGANRFSKATQKNKSKIKKTAIFGAAGALASGAFFYGMHGKAGIKEAFVKHALPRIKDFIKATQL